MSSSGSIVIYRLGSLGDTVVALPFFHAINRRFPGAERILLTNVPVSAKAPPAVAVLGANAFIDRVLSYPVGTRRPADVLSLMRSLRDTGADTLVFIGAGTRGVTAAWRDWLFFRAAGFRRIIGAPLSRELDAPNVDPRTGELEHETERLARCLALLGPHDLSDPAAWDFRLTAAEVAAGQAVLAPFWGRPFLAINTGGKSPLKEWGEVRWLALLGQLADKGLGLLVVGGVEDSERGDGYVASWPGPGVNACGLGPRETVAALRHAALFIGHDSGPMHLAAAAGAPTIGLHGALFRPRVWHPMGGRVRMFHDQRGVANIEVDVVEAAARSLLSG
jgi:ADP-heptose:LPS heptosyltransferase